MRNVKKNKRKLKWIIKDYVVCIKKLPNYNKDINSYGSTAMKTIHVREILKRRICLLKARLNFGIRTVEHYDELIKCMLYCA